MSNSSLLQDIPAIAGGLPIRESFLAFGRPKIQKQDIDEVVRTLKSGWIGTGPKVHSFEEKFRMYKGSCFAVAVNSCTAALHLALLAIGLKPGDEVITSPMTFCATVNAILYTGATPVLVDCERETMNIDPQAIERAITKRTKAILPIHFAGRPCNMDKIIEMAKNYNLKIIEDCAHAIESEYHGKKTGVMGDIGCFSFYVTKNIITGEGGMVTTDNEEYAARIKTMGLHGMSADAWKRFADDGYKHYDVVSLGYKYNMMDMQAAIGLHQLDRIDMYYKKRLSIWKAYDKSFKDLPLQIPAPFDADTRHSLHLYTILLDGSDSKLNRDFFSAALHKENIGIGVHYRALHLHPFYQKTLGYKKGDFPNAEFISDRTISLPLSPGMSMRNAHDVSKAVRRIVTYFSRT